MLALLLLPERDCGKCTAMQKVDWGCDKNAPIPMRIDGEDIYRCPRRPILDNPRMINSVLARYKSYIRGYLPDPGSLEDQAHRFVVSMAIIENAAAEAKEEQERRERKKSK